MRQANDRLVIGPDKSWSGPVGLPVDVPGTSLRLLARHGDDRGWFVKQFQASEVVVDGGDGAVREVFTSSSRRGAVRGLHFQSPPHDHAKTVTCLVGAIFDVVVDLRVGSPTQGQVAQFRLDGEAPARLHLPAGLAHGFQALTPDALVVYVTSTEYEPTADCGVRWDSAGVEWPLDVTAISDRDRSFPTLGTYDSPFEWSPRDDRG